MYDIYRGVLWNANKTILCVAPHGPGLPQAAWARSLHLSGPSSRRDTSLLMKLLSFPREVPVLYAIQLSKRPYASLRTDIWPMAGTPAKTFTAQGSSQLINGRPSLTFTCL